MENQDEQYPRSLSLTPILFDKLPSDLIGYFQDDITMMNGFLKRMGLTREKNINFLSAIKKSIMMLLYKLIKFDFDDSSPPGFFTNPEYCYDSGYIIACLTQHSTFFHVMDDFEFSPTNWNLLNLTNKALHILLIGRSDSELNLLLLDIKKIKKSARDNNWSGTLKVTVAMNMII